MGLDGITRGHRREPGTKCGQRKQVVGKIQFDCDSSILFSHPLRFLFLQKFWEYFYTNRNTPQQCKCYRHFITTVKIFYICFQF